MKTIVLISLLFFSINSFAQCEKVIENAFAHNDYEHKKPLFDALFYGFTYVEADIHLINGKLYVYHDKPEKIDDNRTLENLYLKPLKQLVKKNNGKVYENCNTTFYLMVDIKTDGLKTYKVLKKEIEKYKDVFIHTEAKNNPVRIFISGNRPIKEVLKDKTKIIAVDGRVQDLGKNYSSEFMPVISNSYSEFFGWDGTGEMPKNELKVLRGIVKKTHSENKKLRFWGTPNTIETIKLLIKEKVDLIGTDELNVFTELKSQPIKIMSFNIRYNNPNDGKNRWELRKELVIQNIKEYNSDFVGLQEVTYSQFQYVNSGLSDNYSVIGRCRGVLPTQGEASPIYYKKADWLLLTSGNFWLSETPYVPASKSWNTACTRMASWGLFKSHYSEQQIVVVNTHLDHVSVEARVNGIKLIAEELNKFGNKIPKILMGDFNAEPNSEVYKVVVNKINLHDAYRQKKPKISVNDNTFRAWDSDKGKKRIDYIFTSKINKILKAMVDDGIIDNKYTSDHLPVFIEVEF